MGSGIDTAHNFRNIHATAIKQTKSNLVDFIMGGYHLNEEALFKLQKNMGEVPVNDPAMKASLQKAFAEYKKKNDLVMQGKLLVPDSIYRAYFPK